jgi:hypothetical protein
MKFSNYTFRGIGIAVLGALFCTPGAYAQLQVYHNGCMQQVYNEFNGGQNLVCSANDVTVAAVAIPLNPVDDCDFIGDTTTFDAILTVTLGAQARHDIGVYINTVGGAALSGTSCLISTLPITPVDNTSCTAAGVPHSCCTGSGAGFCGYTDLDTTLDTGTSCQFDNTHPCNDAADCVAFGGGNCVAAGPGLQDLCGDIDDSPNPIQYKLTNVTLTCIDTDNNGFLDVSACTSWRQPGDNDLCRSPLGAFPGAPSKCKCQASLQIPIQVPRTIQVCKDLIPSNDPGLFNLQVDGVTQFANANDGDCTDHIAVEPGNHSVGETAGTGTSLGAYNTNISCVDIAGRCTGDNSITCLVDANCSAQGAGTCNLTPMSVGSCTNCTMRTISISTQAQKIVCTITNTNVCHDVCGNGSCEAGCGEDCSVCPADCGCTPCTQACIAGGCESTCGDLFCDTACEDCVNCPGDCGCAPCSQNCVGGACVSACGDGTCDPTCENCSNCPADCACGSCNSCVAGTCTPDCGDGFCNPACGENCNSCPSDCGCPACQSCSGGVCTPDCGNGVCQPACGENCDTCSADCGCPSCTHNCTNGACVPACGDGICDPSCENCGNCPADCGCAPCTQNCVKGLCVDACGDGTCDPSCENCDNCPLDCPTPVCHSCINGVVTSNCGNGSCDPACENCSTCPADCGCTPCTTVCTLGECVPTCGDGACDPSCENCGNCPADCGCAACTVCAGTACVSACGDGTCDPTCENCSNCPGDCGCGPCNSCVNNACTPDCGNGICDPLCENCNSCPADCGCVPCSQTCVNGTCTSSCGDGVCDQACEDCSTCPSDCGCEPCTEVCSAGECMNTCGDGICDPNCENCINCEADCGCTPCTQSCNMGICEPTCGDGACDPNCEDCGNCAADCGCSMCYTCLGAACMSDCGDGVCDANCENCGTCPSDCACNDGVACTNDLCKSGVCVYGPNNAKCDDGDFCNGAETCDPVLGCLPGDSKECAPPTLTCPPDVVCECDAAQCPYGDPVLVDDCSVSPTYDCTEEVIPGKFPQTRTIVRTCMTTNDCGASDSCVQEIEIVDTTPPEITCPSDATCECGQPCNSGEPVVTDNCDPDPDVTVTIETVENNCQPLQTAGIAPPPKLINTITYTASDGVNTVVATGGGGNTASCTQTVFIEDTVPPILTGCSQDYDVCPGALLDFTVPGCDDLCGSCSVQCVRSDGQAMDAPMPAGSISVTCTATDECQNDSACTVNIENETNCDPEIPTVSEWGLVVLTLLLLIGAKLYFGRRDSLTTA